MEYLEYYTNKEGDNFKPFDYESSRKFSISDILEFKLDNGENGIYSYLFSNGIHLVFKKVFDGTANIMIEYRKQQLEYMRKYPQSFERYKDGMERDLKYLPQLGWMPTTAYEEFISIDKKMIYHDGHKTILVIETGEVIAVNSDSNLEELSIKLIKNQKNER